MSVNVICKKNATIKYLHRDKKPLTGSTETNVLVDQEGRKETFYLMMHSTHCIYGYMVLNH